MVVNILILALGIALGAAAVLLRKKIGTDWMIALLCGAVLVGAVGGVFTWASWKDNQEDKEQVYIALQYLQYNEIESASFHLKKVEGDTFVSAGTEALMETMRDNSILAQVKLDALQGFIKTDEQRGIATKLKSVTSYDYDSQQTAIQLLLSQMKLSDKQKRSADIQFASESGHYVEGLEMDEQELGADASLRMEINNCINYGSHVSAVEAAVRLVDLSASAENRLLLAETIAEAVYTGNYLTGYEFSVEEEYGYDEYEEEADVPNAVKERERLQVKIDELYLEAEKLQVIIDGFAEDNEGAASYVSKLADVNSQIQKLEKSYNYLFVRRALNSIADIHSLKAAVVRARLYFAMQDYEKAVDVLQKAANSPAAWFSTDSNLRASFQILKKVYSEAKTAGTQSVEFQEAITTLLSSGGSDMIGIATSRLTKSFADYVVSDQKTYGKDLYSAGVDLSNYPEVVVHLSGRDTILEMLIAKKDVVVRDTHHDVSYTVVVPEEDSTFKNICCVVDESGSMSGEPTQNLRSALSGFIAALDANTNLGIVGFENSYTIHAPMSTNLSAAEAAVSQIGAYGGTDITAGILGAMDAMQNCVGTKTVLLMTDGQSSIDMSVVGEAAETGYIIHCIGFGDVNDDLLQEVAGATGGQYIKAETSSELVNIYLSLVGVIGNEVEIHYTVTEQTTEEVTRYFFVRIPGYEVSLRVEYVMPDPVVPELEQVYPALIYEDSYSGSQTFDIYGDNLLDVSEVTMGGYKAAIIEQYYDDHIRVEVPAQLQKGWYDVTLKLADGTEITYERMVCVAEYLDAHYFRASDLLIYGNNAGLTDDGMLVVADDVNVTDQMEGSWGEETLNISVYGMLMIPVDESELRSQLNNGGGYYDTYTITITGDIQGAGRVVLNSSDSGYAYDASNMIMSGRFALIYADGRARLVQG